VWTGGKWEGEEVFTAAIFGLEFPSLVGPKYRLDLVEAHVVELLVAHYCFSFQQ